MFEGDEFHHPPFISSSSSSRSTPSNSLTIPVIPLSTFPLHGHGDHNSFSDINPFTPFSSSSSSQPLLLLQHQQVSAGNAPGGRKLERDRVSSAADPAWSPDEVLALLKIRSSMDLNWYSDLSWEHVSRKLGELGFERSGHHCKERFEEESSLSFAKNYRNSNVFTEFEAFFNGDVPCQEKAYISAVEEKDAAERGNREEDDKIIVSNDRQELDPCRLERKKKRKRSDKFEMFKGFCEELVRKMIDQQEELLNKMIDDMVKRDQEMVEREESWKKQEVERIKLENEMKAKEQAIAGERQATIIQFLNRFRPTSDQDQAKKVINSTSRTNIFASSHENPSSNLPPEHNKVSQPVPISPASPSSSSLSVLAPPCRDSDESRGSVGRRWPREEVQTLINLRCKLSTAAGSVDESKEAAGKGPLWERISKGMLELGYKRSAKRCKEKWENINKYFRKTKDNKKKRSTDSRTCPYFHQLNSLYSDGTLVHNAPENE